MCLSGSIVITASLAILTEGVGVFPDAEGDHVVVEHGGNVLLKDNDMTENHYTAIRARGRGPNVIAGDKIFRATGPSQEETGLDPVCRAQKWSQSQYLPPPRVCVL